MDASNEIGNADFTMLRLTQTDGRNVKIVTANTALEMTTFRVGTEAGDLTVRHQHAAGRSASLRERFRSIPDELVIELVSEEPAEARLTRESESAIRIRCASGPGAAHAWETETTVETRQGEPITVETPRPAG